MRDDNTMRYMFSFLRGHRMSYWAGLLMLASCGLVENIFTGQLYGAITSFQDGRAALLSRLLRAGLLMALLLIMVILGTLLYTGAAAKTDQKVRRILSSHLIRMPMKIWNKRHTAEWLTILGKDTDDAAEAYKTQANTLLGYVIQAAGGFVILLLISLPLALCTLGIGIFYMGTGMIRRRRMRSCTAGQRENASKVAEQTGNLIEGAVITRFYQVGGVLERKQEEVLEKNYTYGKEYARISFVNGMLGQLGYMLAYTGALLFGLILVYRDGLSLTVMMELWPISVGVSYAIQKIGFFASNYQPTASAVDRIKQIMELPAEEESACCMDGSELKPESNDKQPLIEWRNVTYSYTEEKQVLKGVSLKIYKGEKVAFVGESGSGKTTLLKLLFRFYEPQEGEILLEGIPVTQYSLKQLRSHFSYVPQRAYLVDGSISENIALTGTEAAPQQIEEAAKKAYADEFIRSLPGGYEAKTGEGGSNLSGGQMQRISIAQCFMRDAPIIVLDEITAALDSESEQKVNASFRDLEPNKTLLYITHKEEDLKNADRIAEIKDGRIITVRPLRS